MEVTQISVGGFHFLAVFSNGDCRNPSVMQTVRLLAAAMSHDEVMHGAATSIALKLLWAPQDCSAS